MLNGLKRSGFPEIWPKMAKKWAKSAKIKVFDSLIKIESILSVGNDFKWFSLSYSSSLIVLNGRKWSGVPEIWPKIAEKYAKCAKVKVFDTLIKIESLVLTGNHFK